MNAVTLGTFKANDRTRQLVNHVLDTGRLSYGPLSGEFEARFALQHNCKYAILSNSGTSALQVALQAMKELYGWADGDEVLVPALTFVATVNIVYHCKLTPVLVDIDIDDYCLDPQQIENHITERTRAIIPVHPFGQPADMFTINEIAGIYDLKILEDSCESMFVSTHKRSVGSWGDAAAFSTYVAHIITTGVGGITTTSDQELALHIRSLVNHGIDVDELPSSSHYDPSHLARKFCFTSIGHSFRVSELEAALGIPQLEEWHTIIDRRQENALFITEVLQDYQDHLQLPWVRPDTDHAFMMYPILIKNESKHGIMNYLREHRIEVRDMLPLTTQPCYSFNPNEYPVAQYVNEHGFYVGCHQDLGKSELTYLAETITDYVSGNHKKARKSDE